MSFSPSLKNPFKVPPNIELEYNSKIVTPRVPATPRADYLGTYPIN